MTKQENQFNPCYAIPPGWILEEELEAHGISQDEFARRCGLPPDFIAEIIAGKASLEPETARQFEKVLGIPAYIWLGMEEKHKSRQALDEKGKNPRPVMEKLARAIQTVLHIRISPWGAIACRWRRRV